MYFSDSWSFIVQTEDNLMIPVDLQESDDWGDIEPVRDEKMGVTYVTMGKEDDEEHKCSMIIGVWEYVENEPFNGKFASFRSIDMKSFVLRLLDAGVKFHGQTEDDYKELKDHYGV